MPNIPLPQNGESFLKWAMANPEAVRDAIDLLNRLAALEVSIVPPGGNNGYPVKPVDGKTNLLLSLPLQFSNNYSAPTGTASRATFDTASVTTAQLAQRVKALIDDLRSTKMAPNG